MLHPEERALAKALFEKAQAEGLPYTLEQIEDALRWADNLERDESFIDNIFVRLDGDVPAGDYDAARSVVGGGFLVQDFSSIEKPSQELRDFIVSQTSNTYRWQDHIFAIPRQSLEPVYTWDPNEPRYRVFGANGKLFNLRLADCPTVACTNSFNIAHFGLSPTEQAALDGYYRELGLQDYETAPAVASLATLVSPIGAGAYFAQGGILLAKEMAKWSIVNFGIGAGIQTAGDIYKTGEPDWKSSVVSGGLAVIYNPRLGGGVIRDAALGGSLLGMGAIIGNEFLDGNTNVAESYKNGAFFAGAGSAAGSVFTNYAYSVKPQWQAYNPEYSTYFALLLQPPPRPASMIPVYLGQVPNTGVSNYPTLFMDLSRGSGGEK